jgi:ubiquinone/menaquinone biosynthesis C-methylase UbiE
MSIWVYLVAAGVALLIAIALVWRVASGRRELPCPSWLRWMVELDNPFTRTNRAAVIVEHLGLEEGMAVLDFGCGPGRLAVPLARAVGPGGKVVAVDIQEGMLARAKHKAGQAGTQNIDFLQAGAGEGKLGTNRFDRALLVTVLGEIPDGPALVREVYEALRPGGILSVTEVIFDPHFRRQKTVSGLGREAGFELQAVFGNAIAYTMHLRKPAQGDL